MNALAADAAQRLHDYLLSGAVQVQQGTEAGAVAGTSTQGGAPLYVYGEITGYYLHWLAGASGARAVREAAANAALEWLGGYLNEQPWPPTRRYLQAAPADWRNAALFAFDLGMIAGGMARCETAGLSAVAPAAVARLDALLAKFTAGDALATVITAPGSAPLPGRWSTLGGPFTAKTASRVLLLHTLMPMAPRLVAQCEALLRHYAQRAADFPPEMLHPTLYAFEGVLLDTAVDWEQVARGLERVLQLQAADGSLPESLETPEVRRNDIVAQALRLAVLIERRLGDTQRFAKAIELLAGWLVPQIGADGRLPFVPAQQGTANTWCSMFAEQALQLYVARQQQAPLPLDVADLV